MTTELTRDDLVRKLQKSLDLLEQLITDCADEPAKQSHMVGRYAETLVRAIATLYPPKQHLEVTKGGHNDWDKLSPAERMARIVQARERLDVMEHETKMLAAKEDA